MKTRFNWYMGIHAATSINCRFHEVEYHTHRRFAIEVVPVNDEDGFFSEVPHNHNLYVHLDRWCTETFGRSYTKAGSRWKRGHDHRKNGGHRSIYFFRNRADAATFKFHWHQAQLSQSATILNGVPLY